MAPSFHVAEDNLANAGARPADRTETDERVVGMIRNGEGHVIDSQGEVDGYPELAVNAHELEFRRTACAPGSASKRSRAKSNVARAVFGRRSDAPTICPDEDRFDELSGHGSVIRLDRVC